jgi:hypothetical protein
LLKLSSSLADDDRLSGIYRLFYLIYPHNLKLFFANPDYFNHDLHRGSVKPDIILCKQGGYVYRQADGFAKAFA